MQFLPTEDLAAKWPEDNALCQYYDDDTFVKIARGVGREKLPPLKSNMYSGLTIEYAVKYKNHFLLRDAIDCGQSGRVAECATHQDDAELIEHIGEHVSEAEYECVLKSAANVAAEEGKVNMVKYLFAKGAKPNDRYILRSCNLQIIEYFWAHLSYERYDVAEEMLRMGCTQVARHFIDEPDDCILRLIARCGDFELFKEKFDTHTPLDVITQAIHYHNNDIAMYAIEHVEDLSSVDEQIIREVAVENNNMEMVQYTMNVLLSPRVDMMDHAVKSRNHDMIDMFVNTDQLSFPRWVVEELFECHMSDEHRASILRKLYYHNHFQNGLPKPRKVLSLAVKVNDVEFATELMGITDVSDEARQCAAHNGNMDMIRMVFGDDLMWILCANGHMQAVKKFGTADNINTELVATSVAQNGHLQLLIYLLRHGLDGNRYRCEIMMHSAMCGQMDVLSYWMTTQYHDRHDRAEALMVATPRARQYIEKFYE